MRVTDEPDPAQPESTEPDPTGPAEDSKQESEWARRRRLAAVFGDVLPETTEDERETSAPGATDASDAWLEEQVPPHHGGT